MKLKVGMSLVSATDATTVLVVRIPPAEASLTCGGVEMLDMKPAGAEKVDAAPDHREPTALGKRYADERNTVEVLCTHAGDGALAYNGQQLVAKDAKPLPASD